MTVRTRVAPSPTGEFHIGGIRTLLYNYTFAKKNGGQFILRIEDTDQARLVAGALERMLAVIKDYGLSWDEGPQIEGPYAPYIQSQRLDLYKKYVEELVAKGVAYYCFCSKERLESLRNEQKSKGAAITKYDKFCSHLTPAEVSKNLEEGKSHVIRLNVPADQTIEFNDVVLGKISINTNEIDDQVLLKSDGFPTYHLSVVVDDHLMKISHVLRGVEWLPSTPKHILLYKAFGWEIPVYGHLSLLKEIGENKKMSKRNASVSAVEFLKDGYLPEALLNFVMFLGWNPGTEKEIYSLQEFVNDFSLEHLQHSDMVVFDREKLYWMNGHYVRALSLEELLNKILVWAKKYDQKLPLLAADKTYVLAVLKLVHDRLKVFKEIDNLTHYFFTDPVVSPEMLNKYGGTKVATILTGLCDLYQSVEIWDVSTLDKVSHDFLKSAQLMPKEAFMTLRVALTGETTTPPIFEVLEVLGRETVLRRLNMCR